jgi:hypothetical protein
MARGHKVEFDPDIRKWVFEKASKGATDFGISRELGVTKRMLQYRCSEELRTGHDIAIQNGLMVRNHAGDKLRNPNRDLTDEEIFQIKTLAGYGLPVDQIAMIIGMSKNTMVANFQREIDEGRAEAHGTVAKVLFEMATDKEHPSETKFFLKAQAKWREATQIEFPDENGVPQLFSDVNVNIALDSDKIDQLIVMLNEKI